MEETTGKTRPRYDSLLWRHCIYDSFQLQGNGTTEVSYKLPDSCCNPDKELTETAACEMPLAKGYSFEIGCKVGYPSTISVRNKIILGATDKDNREKCEMVDWYGCLDCDARDSWSNIFVSSPQTNQGSDWIRTTIQQLQLISLQLHNKQLVLYYCITADGSILIEYSRDHYHILYQYDSYLSRSPIMLIYANIR